MPQGSQPGVLPSIWVEDDRGEKAVRFEQASLYELFAAWTLLLSLLEEAAV